MSADLLKCIICPKKPKFSDVSHLLTHVGSKGHLAHLHGLQVRSHQEIEAGQRLTTYNQWFQEHGVATLLSERMQQKEQKQAVKKAANRRRMATTGCDTKSKVPKISSKQQDPPVRSAYSAEPYIAVAKEESVDLDDVSDPSIGTISHYPLLLSSPPKFRLGSEGEDDEYPGANPEIPAKDSPGSPKLKGTQWPGMALFDAATEELRRKRNQRKDGSVLERLERNAALVRPTETVHSTLGNILKHRHMDDIENDSPVEGEESIMEPTPKKRKSRAPQGRRQPKPAVNKRPGRPSRRQLVTPSKPSTSSASGTSRSVLQSSPAECASSDIKPIARTPNRRKNKKRAFTIYEDSSPARGVDGSSEANSSAYVDTGTVRSQLVFRQLPNSRQQVEAYDPFKLVRNPLPPTNPGFADLGRGKENHQNSFFTNLSPHHQAMTNPLFFNSANERYGTNELYEDETRLNPIRLPELNPFIENDAFMPSRNPLMVAMDQLTKNEEREEDYQFDMATVQHYQPLFAP